MSYVKSVEFHLNDDRDNLRGVEVTNSELFNQNGIPVPNGIYDLNMGTIEYNLLCTVCDSNKKYCEGHSGHMQLRTCIIQPIAIKEVRRWLKITCFECGNLLIDRESMQMMPLTKRLRIAANDEAFTKCNRCGLTHNKIIKDEADYFTFFQEYQSKNFVIYPDAMRIIFSRVSEADGKFMAKVHPSSLIIKIMNIPPNIIRPGVRSFTGASNTYHDTTHFYQKLVQQNEKLPDRMPDSVLQTVINTNSVTCPVDLDMKIRNLQQICYQLIKGIPQVNTSKQTGKRALTLGAHTVQSFIQRLAKKKGDIRQHILATRVLFMGRTTISGDMRLKCDSIGIPLEFARVLQIEEQCQEYNRDFLMKFFLNGRHQYPGATILKKHSTGEIHDISNIKHITLEYGDILYRDMVDGDWIQDNRQPSLERSNIGSHKAKIITNTDVHTQTMNVMSCDWYNADFDGDQMNMKPARTAPARADAEYLSTVRDMFISFKNAMPVIGEVQDSILGTSALTREHTKINKLHAMQLVNKQHNWLNEPNDKIYNGCDILSIMLEDIPINYKGRPVSYNDTIAPYIEFSEWEKKIVIKGNKVTGIVDKSAVGTGVSNGILHKVYQIYGSTIAFDLAYNIQQTALQYLMYSGTTISSVDLTVNKETENQIVDLVTEVLIESKQISNRLIEGKIISPIDKTRRQYYEDLQINALTVSDEKIFHLILDSLYFRTNGYLRMIFTGSGGKLANAIKTCGYIGQIKVKGLRAQDKLCFGRTSPFYTRFALEPEAKGFIASSYMRGQNNCQYYFNAEAGRDDLLSKALSTAVTGDFMRKSVMNLQSLLTNNFRQTSKNHKIVQLIYGDDAFDPRRLIEVAFPTVMMTDEQIKELTTIDKEYEQLIADRNHYREYIKYYECTSFNQRGTNKLFIPVNVNNILESIKPGQAIDANKAYTRLTKYVDNFAYLLLNKFCQKNKRPIPNYLQAACIHVKIHLRYELRSEVSKHFSDDIFQYIIDTLDYKYLYGLIACGAAVGILAAQGIAQPLTQTMLDSHHGSISNTLSNNLMQRADELFRGKAFADELNVRMLLPIKEGYDAKLVANEIEHLIFQNFVKSHYTLYENINNLEHPTFKSDKVWIAAFMKANPNFKLSSQMTNWCFRFEIDKIMLVLKSISLETLCVKLRLYGLYVVSNTESDKTIIIRTWLNQPSSKKLDLSTYTKFRESVLNINIRGIVGIVSATADTLDRFMVVDGVYKQVKVPIVLTNGSNLLKIINHPAVISEMVLSSSVDEMYRTFGIESARTTFINEVIKIMGEKAPNLRHICLYVDELFRQGKPGSIERAGFSQREPNNILGRAAYGAPVPVFEAAALNNIHSDIYGIFPHQMIGGIPQIGSLYNEFIIDEEYVNKNYKGINSFINEL